MTIRYTNEAHRDLLDAFEYIARENPAGAGRLADRMFALLEQLDLGDFEGAEVRLSSGEVLRSWAVPPYRVYYLREPEGRPITK